jgi:hypothetical protein
MMTRLKGWVLLVVGIILGIKLLSMLPVVDVEAQTAPFLFQLANGSSTGNGIDTARGSGIGNFPLASTLTSRNQTGAQLVVGPSQWSVPTSPASGSVASASIAAETGVRHVLQCVGWSADASAAVAAAAGTVTIRDGATGAGTILAQFAIAHQVAAGAGIQTVPPAIYCGMSLTGTAATAMTAEFDAGVTGEVQRVWISGINVS